MTLIISTFSILLFSLVKKSHKEATVVALLWFSVLCAVGLNIYRLNRGDGQYVTMMVVVSFLIMLTSAILKTHSFYKKDLKEKYDFNEFSAVILCFPAAAGYSEWAAIIAVGMMLIFRTINKTISANGLVEDRFWLVYPMTILLLIVSTRDNGSFESLYDFVAIIIFLYLIFTMDEVVQIASLVFLTFFYPNTQISDEIILVVIGIGLVTYLFSSSHALRSFGQKLCSMSETAEKVRVVLFLRRISFRDYSVAKPIVLPVERSVDPENDVQLSDYDDSSFGQFFIVVMILLTISIDIAIG